MTGFLIAMGILVYAVLALVVFVGNLLSARRAVLRFGMSLSTGQVAELLTRALLTGLFWPVLIALRLIGTLLGSKD